MTDISSITSLITAFRNETREEAITPEVLGALLQKIADIMGKAALQTDINLLNKWRINVVNIGEILSEIRVGKDDRNNVYFSLEKVEMANANIINLPDQLVIRQATTERAGAMRAQQVIDLNKCKADIAACISSIRQVEESVTNVQNENKTLNTRIGNTVKVLVDHSGSISNLQKDIKAVLAKIKTLQTDIQNVDALKQTTQMHIECIIKDKKLVIQNAYRYVLKGLTPVIFRHSVRTSRKKKTKMVFEKNFQEDVDGTDFMTTTKLPFDLMMSFNSGAKSETKWMRKSISLLLTCSLVNIIPSWTKTITR